MRDHLNKYYVFFFLNCNNANALSYIRRKGISDNDLHREHFEGFRTKVEMLNWIFNMDHGLESYQMLKPIN